MIVAIAEKNRVMGNEGKLPWNIPDDLKHFKNLTMGHPVIMGRKTYESIGKALPNRTNIVITRDPAYNATGCTIATSLDEAVEIAQVHESEELFIIGGAEIFRLAMGLADRLYLTLIQGDIEGDTFFPEYSAFNTIASSEDHSSESYHYTFLTLEKS